MRASLFVFPLLLAALLATGCSEEESPTDQTDACGAVAARLQSCGFDALVGSASYSCDAEDFGDAEGMCRLQCALQATCEDLAASYCGDLPLDLLMCSFACVPMMACGDGLRVPEELRCDGYADCNDGSDETHCAVFTCTDGEEIPADYECDGWGDCTDGSDEHAACPPEPVFTCTDGEEIPADYECDGWDNCADASDEAGCPIFTCTSGQEIPADQECDEWMQCSDGSDEHAGCWYNTVCQ